MTGPKKQLGSVHDKIWHSPQNLAHYLIEQRKLHQHLWGEETSVCLASGGFDVLHFGHTRYMRAAAAIATHLIVAVNGDGFLIRKKGHVVMPLRERLEMVASLEGVYAVTSWDDGSQFVDGLIRLLRPNFFAKGGDRSCPDDVVVEERKACEHVGCEVVYGVGGSEKVQSSRWIFEWMRGCST